MIRYAVNPNTSEVIRRSTPASKGGALCEPVDLDIFKSEIAAKGIDPESLIYWLCPSERFEELRSLTKDQVSAKVAGGEVIDISAAQV